MELDYDQLARGRERYEKIPYRKRDDEAEMRKYVDPDWKRILQMVASEADRLCFRLPGGVCRTRSFICYSCRNADIGSIFVARLAGMELAATATTIIATAAAPIPIGSTFGKPKRKLRIECVKSPASNNPSESPEATGFLFPQRHPQDIPALCAQGHANADFIRPPHHRIRNCSV